MPLFNSYEDNIVNDEKYCFNQPGCVPMEKTIENVRLAQAYVPYQFFCNLFNYQTALEKGTAFPELYKPYMKQWK